MNSPWLEAAAALDITEVPGIDDFHAPRSALLLSQDHAAEVYGAGQSRYLVNGASSGLHALFLALGGNGGRIIVPRNAHRSFYAGMIISGVEPCYLPVECEPITGEAVAVNPEAFEMILTEYGESSQAVFLTSPSFLGTTCDLAAAQKTAARFGLPLCVDEAHGGHFAFHPAYPLTAMQSGAAAAVNGLHKNLAVLNQGAILHAAASFPDIDKLVKAVSLLTSTSPSFPILASIELAIEQMEQRGSDLLSRALQFRRVFAGKLNELPGMKLLEEEFMTIPGVAAVDPLKATISCAGTALSGYQLEELLRREKGIQVEMAGPNYIMAMFSPWHNGRDWEDLYCALADAAGRHPGINAQIRPLEPAPKAIQAMNPRQAYYSRWETAPVEDAAGRISAEIVAAYPPGIPCIVPGESISQDMVDYLVYLRETGVRIQGPLDPDLRSLMVING